MWAGIVNVNVSGAFAGIGAEFIDSGDDALGFKMPFDEQAIGGQAVMEWAGGDAVEIGDVVAGDGTEAIDVEVSVLGFEWIESPLDEADVAAEGVFALREFELAANPAVAVRGENRGHVGVEIRGTAVNADEGFGEADEGVAIESTENLAAGVVGDDEGDVGFGFQFGIAPNFAGDLHAAAKFVEGVQRADGDVGGHGNQYKLSEESGEWLVASGELQSG